MQEVIISSYFDISDFTKPVHYYMEDIFFSLQPSKSVVGTVYFKKNSLKLNDNIFGLFNTLLSDYFYQMSRIETFLSDDELGPGPGIYLY